MNVALFDLDNTLIAGDSDYLWGEYLAEIGAVPAEEHRRENLRFFEEYKAGTIDQEEFLRFQLSPLAEHPRELLEAWRERYVRERIEPIVLRKGLELIEQHRASGAHLAIVTSTNAFVTSPIARLLGIDTLLATEPASVDGRYTGGVEGVPCYSEGKVKKVNAWLAEHGLDLRGSWFYSDSFTDVPLLEAVEQPVAVDPDPRLERHAHARGWTITSLR